MRIFKRHREAKAAALGPYVTVFLSLLGLKSALSCAPCPLRALCLTSLNLGVLIHKMAAALWVLIPVKYG